jgi:16S rRNA (cytidine1402-2'-O)-methyltransferase
MLSLVATPIGNLGDITLRALETLREADYIVSEDTRHTGKLLRHFEISKPQISFYEQNKEKALPRIIGLLREGKAIAMVTDAGSPGISDPGFLVVRAALAEGLPVTAVPGPAALIPALVLSGLPVHSFTFRGFPPHKAGPRKRFLAVDADSPHTLIFYESPYRLVKMLNDALEVYGDRRAAVANDLTKLYELVQRGTLSELIQMNEGMTPRGEYVVLVAGKDAE